jgi:hypothetical protein
MSDLKIIKAKDLTDLWLKIGESFLAEKKSRRGAGEYFLYMYNLVAEVNSFTADNLYLEDVGYTIKKANHLLRNYIDPAELNNSFKDMKESSDKWASKEIFTDYSIKTKETSKFIKGPCITAVSYKDCEVPTLTIYSRSMEFPRKMTADIFLVHSLAKLIQELLNVKRNIKIIWYVGTLWLKARAGARIYKIFRLPEEVEFVNKEFQENVQDGWNKYVIKESDITYNELVRVRKLYLAKKKNKINRVTGSAEFLKVFRGYLNEQ